MRRLNKVGLGFFTTLFCAASIAACSASGNDVAGNPGGGGGGSGDSGAVTDSSYGATDSGSQSDSSSGTDSGKATGIDSGVIDDAGVVFTGGGTCDITDGLTITIEELATFFASSSPASCDATTPCDSSHCCLDVASATGGGSLGGGFGPTGLCLTQIDLSGLGL